MVSTSIKLATMALLLADLGFCVTIGIRSANKVNSADDYFIGGKKTNVFVLMMTSFASLLGAGLFVGQAGRGALQGISAYWQLLGEGVVAGIVMALLVGPYLAKFKYFSMAHFIGDHICGGNLITRRIAGVANFLPNLMWPGAQIMGISYVVKNLFNIDYRLTALVCGIVFVFYTACGGIESVLVTDVLHGSIAIVSCFLVIFYGFKLYNFDLGAVKEAVIAIDPTHWDMTHNMTPLQILTAFLTGFLGTLANPIYWNRAFSAKDVSTCRKAYSFAFTVGTILPLATIMLGVIAFTFNPQADDQALVWLVMNKMPGYMTIIVSVAVLAATLSSADTHLNCASANLIADILDPKQKWDTKKTVKYSRIATLCCGAFSVIISMYAKMIYELANFGYAVCGGVLVPLFFAGYLMMDRKSETYSSKLTSTGAILGMLLGMVAAVVFQAVPSLSSFWGGGVIPGVVMTLVGIFVGNLLSKKAA